MDAVRPKNWWGEAPEQLQISRDAAKIDNRLGSFKS
jgi:hypothetical protein